MNIPSRERQIKGETAPDARYYANHSNAWGLCFSPDGKTLATTSSGGLWTNCTIKLWGSARAPSEDESSRTGAVER